jgi:hypothetical protein
MQLPMPHERELMTINDIIATSSVHAFNSGVIAGKEAEKKRLFASVVNYFALSNEPDEFGHYNNNPEWDAGYQAAMAIIKGA